MTSTINSNEYLSKSNQSLGRRPDNNGTFSGQNVYSEILKNFVNPQLIEIFCLIIIFIEHTIVFLITFQKKSEQTNERRQKNQRSILLPTKSFFFSCLHRNWVRAFSFSNICLSIVYFSILLLKLYHPNLVHYSSITFYSLPLNLLKQILINFSTFHLFIISISVFQYFLRYYRLLKNTYSSYFFNGKGLLLTKHKNVALILSSSLALIFAYNFIFYNPKHRHTLALLPLITFNMILLPLINLMIFIFILICFIINYFYKPTLDELSLDNEPENLRLIIEKNTCLKCYSKILERNPNIFQDKNYSYRNLYKIFFPTRLHPSYRRPTEHNSCLNNNRNYSPCDFLYEHEHDLENSLTNNMFLRTTLIKLNRQHSLCHLCYTLLLIFLFKYILLTFPQHIVQMLFHLKQFYEYILKSDQSSNYSQSPYKENENLLSLCHHLFLLSRFGDSFLLIRLSFLIKKYFPCWCHFNSRLLHHSQQQSSHPPSTMKSSQSSYSETMSANDVPNPDDRTNEIKDKKTIKVSNWQAKNRRFRLQCQFVPLWSNTRPKLFKEYV